VILTRTPTFHGLAINAVTNESAKTPPFGRDPMATWVESGTYSLAPSGAGWASGGEKPRLRRRAAVQACGPTREREASVRGSPSAPSSGPRFGRDRTRKRKKSDLAL